MRTNNFFFIPVLFIISLFSFNATQAQQDVFESPFLESLSTAIASLSDEQSVQIVSVFQEGAAIFKQDDKLGLINQQGFEISAAIYTDIVLYHNGYAAVQKHNKWTFLNKQGIQLTPLRYDWVGSFDNNHAAVMYNGKWGMLNEQGFEVVPTEFEGVKYTSGQFWVKTKGKWQQFEQNSDRFKTLM